MREQRKIFVVEYHGIQRTLKNIIILIWQFWKPRGLSKFFLIINTSKTPSEKEECYYLSLALICLFNANMPLNSLRGDLPPSNRSQFQKILNLIQSLHYPRGSSLIGNFIHSFLLSLLGHVSLSSYIIWSISHTGSSSWTT